MILKDLKHVISDDSPVYVQVASRLNIDLPLYYTSWEECKKDFKTKAWNEEITLRSHGAIEIVFTNL